MKQKWLYLFKWFPANEILADTYSGIISGILSDMYSDILSGILSGGLSEIWRSRLRSGVP